MKIFARRPLATACASALAAAVCAFFLPLFGKLILAGTILLSLLLCVLLSPVRARRALARGKRPVEMLTVYLTLGLMLLSVVQSAWHFDLSDRVPQSVADSDCTVECVILEENGAGSGYAYYTARVTAVNGVRTRFRAALECGYTATFHVGDVVTASVHAEAPETYYDRENLLYAVADGIRLGLVSEEAETAVIVGTRDMPLRRIFSRWQKNLTSRLLRLTGKERGGLAAALFLGDRDALDASISTYFRRSGVSHLLALSGMHVTLLLAMLTSLTAGLRIPRKGRVLLLAALAVFYLALTGFRISAIRAVGMVLLFYLADLVGTRHDPLTTLCTVGMTMLTLSPATVADGGFWMSFCAVFGLVTVMPVFNVWLQKKRIPRRIGSLMQAVVASVVAVISVSFLSWLFCGEFAPIGILITVLLTPLLTVILSLTPLLLLLDLLPMLSATPIAAVLNVLLTWMIDLTDRVAHLHGVSISLRVPFAGVILVAMTAVLLLMLILPLRRKFVIAFPPVAAALAFVICLGVWNHATYSDQLRAAYMVRSSGSALVLTDGAETAIIDTSSGSYAMLRDAERAATSLGATEIDSLVLTHYHRAFVYSTERLAKRQIIRRVFVPIPKTESEYFVLIAMRDRLEPLGTEVLCYGDSETLLLLADATYLRADAATIKRSTQPIVTYLVQTSREILTFTNLSVQESEYYPTFRWIAERADVLILGEDGPRLKTMLSLPDTMSARLLLTDSADVLPYLDLSPSSSLYGIPHVTDITRYTFTINK